MADVGEEKISKSEQKRRQKLAEKEKKQAEKQATKVCIVIPNSGLALVVRVDATWFARDVCRGLVAHAEWPCHHLRVFCVLQLAVSSPLKRRLPSRPISISYSVSLHSRPHMNAPPCFHRALASVTRFFFKPCFFGEGGPAPQFSRPPCALRPCFPACRCRAAQAVHTASFPDAGPLGN